MALFLSGVAKEKPAPSATDEIGKLRAELQRTKDAARLRAKHGSHLTDEQVDEYLAAEADMVLRKARAAAAETVTRASEEKRRNDLIAAAIQYVKDRRLLIDIGGTRVPSIDKDLSIPCPACGAAIHSLGGIEGYLGAMVKIWHDATEEQRKMGTDAFIIRNACNPLSDFYGSPMVSTRTVCPGCKAVWIARIQLVVL